jgi:Domain of unknown function (DUF5664)
MSGTKFDEEKLEYHLLSTEAEKGLIQILMFGKTKYGAFNWAKGLKYHRVYNALLRHLKDWWAGEELDPETGLSHVYHAFCNAMFLAHFVSHPGQYAEFDDRQIEGMEDIQYPTCNACGQEILYMGVKPNGE